MVKITPQFCNPKTKVTAELVLHSKNTWEQFHPHTSFERLFHEFTCFCQNSNPTEFCSMIVTKSFTMNVNNLSVEWKSFFANIWEQTWAHSAVSYYNHSYNYLVVAVVVAEAEKRGYFIKLSTLDNHFIVRDSRIIISYLKVPKKWQEIHVLCFSYNYSYN